jgi:chromosome condensin MukBEF complex kleisin-like MukF subunit
VTLSRNIVARDRFTARLSGDQPSTVTKVQMTGPQAEEALFGWIYKQPGMPTAEDCRHLLDRIYKERGPEDATFLMQRFGCNAFKDLWIGLYERFFKYARTSLFFGVSPAYGWESGNDVKPEMRDRWLMWHPESNNLFEVRHSLDEEMFLQGCEDVSGVVEYEDLFYEQLSEKAEEL